MSVPWYTQRLEALEAAECYGNPGLTCHILWASSEGDKWYEAAQQLPTVAPVVDT